MSKTEALDKMKQMFDRYIAAVKALPEGAEILAMVVNIFAFELDDPKNYGYIQLSKYGAIPDSAESTGLSDPSSGETEKMVTINSIPVIWYDKP